MNNEKLAIITSLLTNYFRRYIEDTLTPLTLKSIPIPISYLDIIAEQIPILRNSDEELSKHPYKIVI
jgi:hypothetical protein